MVLTAIRRFPTCAAQVHQAVASTCSFAIHELIKCGGGAGSGGGKQKGSDIVEQQDKHGHPRAILLPGLQDNNPAKSFTPANQKQCMLHLPMYYSRCRCYTCDKYCRNVVTHRHNRVMTTDKNAAGGKSLGAM